MQALRRSLIAQRGHLTRSVNRFDTSRTTLGSDPSKAELTVFHELYQTVIERHKKCIDILDQVCAKVSEEIFTANFSSALNEMEAKADQVREQYVVACNAGGGGGAGGGAGGGGAGKGAKVEPSSGSTHSHTHPPTVESV